MTGAAQFEVLARADMLALLGVAFALPTHDLAEGLVQGAYQDDVRAVLSELPLSADDVQSASVCVGAINAFAQVCDDEESLFTALRIEYTRLFVNPAHEIVNPHEAVFLAASEKGSVAGSLFISPIAQHVESYYHRAGFVRAHDFRESPDNIVAELSFMRELEIAQAKAQAESGSAAGNRDQKLLDSFLADHAMRWMPDFFQAVQDSSENGFYRGMARIGQLLLACYGLTVHA